jgi:hypothetical protein
MLLSAIGRCVRGPPCKGKTRADILSHGHCRADSGRTNVRRVRILVHTSGQKRVVR